MYKNILINLLWLSQVISSRITCPSQCFCNDKIIDCSNKSLLSLSEIESAVENFDDVDVSHNHLSWVPVLHAKKIVASSNSLQEFPKLSPITESVILNHNNIRFISERDCPPSLKYLDLSENPIKDVNLHCEKLQKLNISLSDIDVLPENFLGQFPSLQILHIDDSPLKKVSGELRSDTLEVFTLQRTQLRYIKPSFFSGLTKLKVVNLSGNKYIHSLQPISVAEIFLANHCSLETIDLTGMSYIREVQVNNNHINSISIPESMIQLEASNNRIYSIDLKRLKRADLSENLIVSINLKPMQWLNISGNPISNLRLASIIFLDASQCRISHVEPSGSKLHTLNLSHNSLEALPHGIHVRKLDVSFNRLSSFKYRMDGLEEVRLVGNRLVLAEDVIGQGLMYLSDNPWTCDCKMDHLYKVAADVKDLKCAHPQNVTGRSWTDACYRSRIPRWMLNHPYIPFIVSTGILILAFFFFYWLRRKMDPPTEQTEHENEAETESVLSPPVRHINNDLPSYEEALLMPGIARKVNVVTQTRSYEVLSRRLSSNSI